MFIELISFYTDDETDYELLGIEPDISEQIENASEGETMVNFNNVTEFNASDFDGVTTVEFVGGVRVMFKIDYDELKSIVNANR